MPGAFEFYDLASSPLLAVTNDIIKDPTDRLVPTGG